MITRYPNGDWVLACVMANEKGQDFPFKIITDAQGDIRIEGISAEVERQTFSKRDDAVNAVRDYLQHGTKVTPARKRK
jgi:hypothetical protein